MIRQFKTKISNIVISGILPRMSANGRFYGKARTINNRLDSLCSQEGVDFVNLWDDFYNKPFLFQYDGLHLNSVGMQAWADFSVTKFFSIGQKTPSGREQQRHPSYSV